MSASLPRQTFPAFLAASACALGIFAVSLLPAAVTVRWAVLAALMVVCVVLLVLLLRRTSEPLLVPLAIAFFLGASLYLFDPLVGDPALPFGRTVEFTGEVAAPPAVTGTTTRCLLRSVKIRVDDRERDVRGLLLATVRQRRGAPPAIRYGSVIAATGTLARTPVRRNPGEFNLRRFYEAQGVAGLVLIRDGRALRILEQDRGSPLMAGVILPLKAIILSAIDSTVGGEEGEFLKGLLLGERSGLPVPLKEAFALSGVAHVLAVSGSNVAVVAGAMFLLLTVLRCPAWLRPWFLSGGILLYMVLTGNQPPVVRATIMALVFLWSRMRQERPDPYNVLGVAALIILVLEPRQLFDVGFQLSFVAVLSLVHIFPRIRTLYAGVTGREWYRRLALGALDLVSLTLAATLGTLPITAAVFGRVSIIGLLANVVVVPASGLAVLLGMTTIAASLLSAWLGAVYGDLLRLILRWTLLVVEMAGGVPFAALETYRFSAVDALPYYAALGLAVHLRPPPIARRLVVVLAGALLLWWFLPRTVVPSLTGTTIRCTVLDVGQGDAILLQFPGGSTMLVDTGPAGSSGDAGKRVIIPYLLRLGVDHIDLLLVTHGHDDHTGGVASVVRAFPVRRILVPSDSTLRRIPPGIRAIMSVVSSGDTLSIGGARVYILAPWRTDSLSGISAEAGNESSVVVKVVYGRTSILLTGDEPTELEQVLVAGYGDFLRADLLKVGHHGSLTATSDVFLDAVSPRFAALSVGRFNRHGHPSGEVLRRLEDRGILIGRTDDDGALMYEVSPDTLTAVEWQ